MYVHFVHYPRVVCFSWITFQWASNNRGKFCRVYESFHIHSPCAWIEEHRHRIRGWSVPKVFSCRAWDEREALNRIDSQRTVTKASLSIVCVSKTTGESHTKSKNIHIHTRTSIWKVVGLNIVSQNGIMMVYYYFSPLYWYCHLLGKKLCIYRCGKAASNRTTTNS